MCLGKKRTREDGKELRRSASQRDLVRSNSSSNLNDKRPNAYRNSAKPGDDKLASKDVKDVSIVGVYSREAALNFGRKWKDKMLDDSSNQVTRLSRNNVSPEDAETFLSRQNRTEEGSFNDQVNALFSDKMIPHVIVIIEGREEEDTITLRANVASENIDLGYTRTDYVQGKTKGGSYDNKQSMSVYLRDDMRDVYSISNETVERGNGSIKAVGINFQTVDGKKYRSLVVHIPNEFIKGPREIEATHAAFEKYATKAAKEASPVIVTGYLGDTNYKTPIYENTVPSMGGRTPEGYTLNPQSSGAGTDTNFMQHVPLGESSTTHRVFQPSTTNYVFPFTDEERKVATDHPSMMTYTGLPNDMAGRNSKINNRFYGEE